MAIAEGSFNLLVAEGDPRRRELRYRLFANDLVGRPFTLAGVKEVEDGWFRDTWVDTTTLFTRLYEGRVTRDDEDGATPMAAGILHVSAGGFLALILSMRGPLRDRLRYGSFFTRSLLQVYLGREHGDGLDRLPGPASGLRALAGLPARGVARLPGAAGPAPADPRRAHRRRPRPHRPPRPRRGRAHQGPGPAPARHRRAREPLLRRADGALDRRRARRGRATTSGSGNWRGSIDLPECDYTLDEVARFDHPALIARRAARDRGEDAQGDRPLPGVDVLRPGLLARPRARR